MTQCTQSGFDFKAHFSRDIVARFDGGTISSDGGSLLLRQTDQRLNLLTRFANCFLDGRRQDRVEHSLVEMISQRVYGLALGYEDLNDHEQLRKDPLFGILAGREELDRPLAGKSTLNRLELGNGQEDRYKKITFWKQGIDEVLVSVFVESQETAPKEIILDVDTTDLPLHGKQEGRFFHGDYDSYCYLPLYIFCGEHVLCARLRQSNSDAATGSLTEIERIVGRGQVPLRVDAIDARQLHTETDLNSGRHNLAVLRGCGADAAHVLIQQILKLRAPAQETGRVHVSEVVGDHLDVPLLGEHSGRRDVKSSHLIRPFRWLLPLTRRRFAASCECGRPRGRRAGEPGRKPAEPRSAARSR